MASPTAGSHASARHRHERQHLQDDVDSAASVVAATVAEHTTLREQGAIQRSFAPVDRAHATRE